jgi:predicted transcriptional regulator
MAQKKERGWTNVDVNLTISSDGDVDPLGVIRGITKGMHKLDKALRDAVASARSRGHSWEEIADALGVTRQSAWGRFAQSDDEERARAIASVAGSMKRPPGAPTFEETRKEEREVESEKERRRYGSNPPGLKWR